MRPLQTIALSLATVLATAAAPIASPSYRVAGRIAGPDGAGWDYAQVDPAAHKLYIARGGSVTVIDLARGDSATSIGTIERGHAALPIPGTTTLLVTSGHDNTVRLLDAQNGREIARLPIGQNPDAAIWDPITRRALVMNAEAGSVSVVNVDRARVERTIQVKPALEYAAIGPNGMLFINDEDVNEVEVVDLLSGKIGTPIALSGRQV